MVVKNSVSRFKYNLVAKSEPSRQLATSAHEITSVLVSGGSGPTTVRIVDSANGAAGYSPSDGFLIEAKASDSQEFVPAFPVPMNKGIYVIFEQGAGDNDECFITWN